jgi:glutaredoxin
MIDYGHGDVMVYEKFIERIPGKKSKDILLFALSTCGWCRKTKGLLDEMGVEYKFVYVDLLEGQAKKEVMREVERWNPSVSFPTMVVDGKECIVGFKEDRIREVVKSGR